MAMRNLKSREAKGVLGMLLTNDNISTRLFGQWYVYMRKIMSFHIKTPTPMQLSKKIIPIIITVIILH